ncbi:hypothetical protein Tco_0339501 [Tanacetum coccineum]
MVKEGIVLGHKVSGAGLEVDKAKINVISKLPPPTNVKGIRIPTGRVVVPTGRYVVPAGKVIIIVSPGRLNLVPTGRILSPGSDNDSDDASVHSETFGHGSSITWALDTNLLTPPIRSTAE